MTQGVSLDFAEAMGWSKLAAGKGHADAQVVLGFMYHIGQWGPQNYVDTVRWSRLAEEQDKASAQCKYAIGQGMPQDRADAVR